MRCEAAFSLFSQSSNLEEEEREIESEGEAAGILERSLVHPSALGEQEGATEVRRGTKNS